MNAADDTGVRRSDGTRGAPGPVMTGRVSVVMPARDAASLLPRCLQSITPQLRSDDDLIVVDDASGDDTVAIAARHGARVIRSDRPLGPYAARNRGWRASTNDIVCFVDSRCRALPGWLETMRSALTSDATAAMACADVETLWGRSLAARVMHRRQSLRAVHSVDNSIFLPWFVTANLAVRRSVLDAVGGFAPVTSGGDADLCWRVQLHGLGDLAVVRHVTMQWTPRGDLDSFVRQWAKYGRSSARLRREYAAYGVDASPPPLWQRLHRAGRVMASDVFKHCVRPDVAAIDGFATWLFDREVARVLRDNVRVLRIGRSARRQEKRCRRSGSRAHPKDMARCRWRSTKQRARTHTDV